MNKDKQIKEMATIIDMAYDHAESTGSELSGDKVAQNRTNY